MRRMIMSGCPMPNNCEMLIRAVPNISPKRISMATMRECPVCGIRVKLENLEGHLKKVHPNVKLDKALTEEDRTDIRIAKKKERKTSQPFEAHERRRWAIAGIVVVAIVSLLIIAMIALPENEESPTSLLDTPAPLFKYNDVDNVPFDLNEHIGNRLILVEFFATECSWCLKMHPNLEEVWADYGYGDEVEIVSISGSSEDLLEEVRAFRDVHGGNWTFIKSPESLAETYLVSATPTTFLIDKNGIIKEVMVGYQTVQQLHDTIEPYL